MVESRPLVSVIMATYNSQEYVRESVESVLAQTECDWELLITDDCSVDSTFVLLQKFEAQDSRITAVRLDSNQGPAVARNTSIERSCGRYIAFLDSDDLWRPRKLEAQLTFMRASNAAIAYTAFSKIDHEGRFLADKMGVPNTICYQRLLKTCDISCSTVIYDTCHFGRVYMPLIRKRQDYGLWLRLLKSRPHTLAHGLNDVLTDYRVLKNSVSRNKLKAAVYQYRVYRELEQLSILEALYYMGHYTYHGTRRNFMFSKK